MSQLNSLDVFSNFFKQHVQQRQQGGLEVAQAQAGFEKEKFGVEQQKADAAAKAQKAQDDAEYKQAMLDLKEQQNKLKRDKEENPTWQDILGYKNKFGAWGEGATPEAIVDALVGVVNYPPEWVLKREGLPPRAAARAVELMMKMQSQGVGTTAQQGPVAGQAGQLGATGQMSVPGTGGDGTGGAEPNHLIPTIPTGATQVPPINIPGQQGQNFGLSEDDKKQMGWVALNTPQEKMAFLKSLENESGYPPGYLINPVTQGPTAKGTEFLQDQIELNRRVEGQDITTARSDKKTAEQQERADRKSASDMAKKAAEMETDTAAERLLAGEDPKTVKAELGNKLSEILKDTEGADRNPNIYINQLDARIQKLKTIEIKNARDEGNRAMIAAQQEPEYDEVGQVGPTKAQIEEAGSKATPWRKVIGVELNPQQRQMVYKLGAALSVSRNQWGTKQYKLKAVEVFPEIRGILGAVTKKKAKGEKSKVVISDTATWTTGDIIKMYEAMKREATKRIRERQGAKKGSTGSKKAVNLLDGPGAGRSQFDKDAEEMAKLKKKRQAEMKSKIKK